MHKYTHIEALYQVARHVDTKNQDPECPEQHKVRTPVRFRGTVKLHGSNSGVQCHESELIPQSRNRVLSLDSDNMGFAAFVAEQSETIRDIEQRLRTAHSIDPSKVLVLFGEWIGPSIQNGMAINKLPRKQWVLFAVQVVDEEGSEYLDILPPFDEKYEHIFSVYDAETWELEVDFTSPESKEKAIEEFEQLTLAVENQCPWGHKFGLEGIGEGIVWVPVGEHWGNTDLYWKSKGPKHKEVKRAQRNKSSMDPEVLKSVVDFVDFSVTENRLAKGIDYLLEMNHPLEMRSISHFLKWVGQDIERECRDDLTASDLKWSQVSKAVSAKAKDFFIAKTKTI